MDLNFGISSNATQCISETETKLWILYYCNIIILILLYYYNYYEQKTFYILR